MEVIILQAQLSQKEKMLLEDLKKEEDLCVIKYQSYASQAKDPQLSQLFNKLAGEEQKHYSTINQILQSGGQFQPGQQGQGGGQQGQGQKQSQGGGQMSIASQGMQSGGQMNQAASKINLNQMGIGSGAQSQDQHMLHDMLSTEKYVSSAYDTGVFESSHPNIRQALQKIQQDEQGHGEQIFQYMNSHGMYPVQ